MSKKTFLNRLFGLVAVFGVIIAVIDAFGDPGRIIMNLNWISGVAFIYLAAITISFMILLSFPLIPIAVIILVINDIASSKALDSTGKFIRPKEELEGWVKTYFSFNEFIDSLSDKLEKSLFYEFLGLSLILICTIIGILTLIIFNTDVYNPFLWIKTDFFEWFYEWIFIYDKPEDLFSLPLNRKIQLKSLVRFFGWFAIFRICYSFVKFVFFKKESMLTKIFKIHEDDE